MLGCGEVGVGDGKYLKTDCKKLQDFEHELTAVLLELADFGFMLYESWCKWLLRLSIYKFAEVQRPGNV
jgi:hypothetical protein